MMRFFMEHPATVGETYLEHLLFAGIFGCRMMAGGLACCIHGLLPFLFTSTGSSITLDLHAVLMRKRTGLLGNSDVTRDGSEPEYAI